jgi:tetratricopeptide (TPR) repeat protein
VSDRLAQLLKLLEADPADAFCLYGVAQEYARRGNADEAVRWYDRCLGVDPLYCYAYFHKAKALEELDRVSDAVATLRASRRPSLLATDRRSMRSPRI